MAAQLRAIKKICGEYNEKNAALQRESTESLLSDMVDLKKVQETMNSRTEGVVQVENIARELFGRV